MERKHQDVVQRVDILINGVKKIIEVSKANQRNIDKILEEWEKEQQGKREVEEDAV